MTRHRRLATKIAEAERVRLAALVMHLEDEISALRKRSLLAELP